MGPSVLDLGADRSVRGGVIPFIDTHGRINAVVLATAALAGIRLINAEKLGGSKC